MTKSGDSGPVNEESGKSTLLDSKPNTDDLKNAIGQLSEKNDSDNVEKLKKILEKILPREESSSNLSEELSKNIDEIFDQFPEIGKWILDSYITVNVKDGGKKEFENIQKYREGDKFCIDLSLANINTSDWIYGLIESDSNLVHHPLIAAIHEFKCKNGGIIWYWLGAIYFAIYHVMLSYVIYQHPPPFMYDCTYNGSSLSFICRDDCPDYGIPLKPNHSDFWTLFVFCSFIGLLDFQPKIEVPELP